MDSAAPKPPAAVLALRRSVEPITPSTAINDAADLILSAGYSEMLCLPIVDAGRPVGVISRHRFNEIFLTRFGREIYGRKAVERFMNPVPLTVEYHLPLEQAAEIVSAQLAAPITEDFVITHDGRYIGMGVVVDLLGAMQKRLATQVQYTAQAISHREGEITLTSWASGGEVHLSVADNGKGIAPEHLGKVFDPFFTTKAQGEGTGLGLSISFQIAQAHGGRLAVRSEPGRGTVFTLSLPMQREKATTPLLAEEAA